MNFSINFKGNPEIASCRIAIAAVARLMELAGFALVARVRQRDSGSGPFNRRYRDASPESRGTTAATIASAQVCLAVIDDFPAHSISKKAFFFSSQTMECPFAL